MSERIIGRFFAQAWQRDQAIELWNETFDATTYLLGWDATALQQIEDRDYSSDEIGQAFFDHAGPLDVEIEDGLCAFFGVDHAAEITQPMVNAKRRRHAKELARPLKMRMKVTLDVEFTDDQAGTRAQQSREQILRKLRSLVEQADGLSCRQLGAGKAVRLAGETAPKAA